MSSLDPDLQALQEVRDLAERAWRACEAVHDYTQEQIDRVCAAMAEAGARAAHDLAKLAVEETGIGRVHYKVLKNLFGSELTWESIRHERTVGVVARDEARGITEVATPVGVVAGIVPTTNPTSTALFKALISVKGRNAIVLSPHPRSRRWYLASPTLRHQSTQYWWLISGVTCCVRFSNVFRAWERTRVSSSFRSSMIPGMAR